MPVSSDAYNLLAATAFDSDFWLKSVWNQAETDTLVERVNNDLQLLWRAGQGRVSASLWKKLDNRMKLWVDWKQQYDDAIFARTADPNAWFGRDYDEELRATWVPWIIELVRAFDAEAPAASAALENYGLQDSSAQLEQRVQPPPKSDSGAAWGLGLGIFVTIALIGAGVYLARR